jgi:hypothetical protein
VLLRLVPVRPKFWGSAETSALGRVGEDGRSSIEAVGLDGTSEHLGFVIGSGGAEDFFFVGHVLFPEV